MSHYHNEILVKNIEKLRDANHMSQHELAEIAGTQQSRISKLLGADDSARFSIEQVYKLAEHFNVSIDYLVTGKEPQPTTSKRQICEVLVQLFDKYHLKHNTLVRNEELEIPVTVYEGKVELPGTDTEVRRMEYNTLYFPIVWDRNPDREYTEDELDNLQSDLLFFGNGLEDNMAINKFLSAYIPIHELHDAGKMPDEAYKFTINSLLENL